MRKREDELLTNDLAKTLHSRPGVGDELQGLSADTRQSGLGVMAGRGTGIMWAGTRLPALRSVVGMQRVTDAAKRGFEMIHHPVAITKFLGRTCIPDRQSHAALPQCRDPIPLVNDLHYALARHVPRRRVPFDTSIRKFLVDVLRASLGGSRFFNGTINIECAFSRSGIAIPKVRKTWNFKAHQNEAFALFNLPSTTIFHLLWHRPPSPSIWDTETETSVMTSTLTAASDGRASSKGQPLVYIRSIEIKFKGERNKYPVLIKAKFGENEASESKRYGRDEDIHWLCERKLMSNSPLTIQVQEHHNFSRIRSAVIIKTVTVPLAQLAAKPFFEDRDSDTSPVSVTIHCGSGGPLIEVIRRLVEQSQNQLEAMKVFMEKFGRACEVLDYVVTVTEAISSVHPAAELAAEAATALLEFCQKIIMCHTLASELMGEIATFLPFADIPETGLKCQVTAQTAEEMLVLFGQICTAIKTYSDGSIVGGSLDDRIEEINSFKEKFRRLKETFGWCVLTEVWQTTLKIEETTDALLVEKLDPLKKASYRDDKTCFEGSRRDTLQAIKAWSESKSSPPVFWLSGPSGLGKTRVAHTVARLFDEQNRLAGQFLPADADSSNAGSSESEPCSERVMPTIAYQMAKWHTDYHESIRDLLLGPKELRLYSGLDTQFELLMKQPILAGNIRCPPNHKPLVIVLDAIEKYRDSESCKKYFVDYIVDIATLVPWLKVFVSGGASKYIEGRLGRLGTAVQRLSMDSPTLDLYHDIAVYARLCEERQRSLEEWTLGMESDVRGLLTRISRPFIAGGGIRNFETISSRNEVRDVEVTILVRSVLDRINDVDVAAARSILAFMSCLSAIKTPTEEVLLHFLRASLPNITQDYLRSVVATLFPIIYSGNENTFWMSFPPDIVFRYLSNQQQSGRFYTNMVSLSHGVVRSCLDVTHRELKFNICNLADDQSGNEDIEDRVGVHISGILHYCSLYWMDLVAQSGNIESFKKLVESFLCSRKALFWLEILSLLGELGAGKDILLKCMKQFKEEARILAAATDLHGFISNFKVAIGRSVPRLYISALTWLPPCLLAMSGCRNVGIAFERPTGSATNAPRIDPGCGMTCIARSPDGSRIVSESGGFEVPIGNTSFGSAGVLEIRDGWTGERIGGSIKGHSGLVGQSQILLDETKAFSEILRNYVAVMETLTPEYPAGLVSTRAVHSLLTLLGTQSGYIRDVEFSPDGTKFVSGSTDGAVKIWDAHTRKLVKEMKSISRVNAVAYSADGRRVVSGHGDGRLRVWDAQNGTFVAKSQGKHGDWVRSVAYSPDGRRIVSGSADDTLRIWDAESGAAIGEPLKGHESTVLSVAYSPDGRRIVSGSDDETVRIWDARTGALVGEPLKGHEGSVADVGYSRDGNTIISASRDETTRFWNATDGSPVGVLHRGESRWDPARSHFVSIPEWWPRHRRDALLRIQALVYSANPLYIPDDGWIRTLEGDLLLWVPPEHRACSCHAAAESTMTTNSRDTRLMGSAWKDIWADVERMMTEDETERE